MAKVVGVVEGISEKYPPKVGILVNGKWHNTQKKFLPVGLEKGCEVEFDDGDRNYFNSPKILSGGSSGASSAVASVASRPPFGGRTFPVGALAPERTINRQNALTNAASLVSSFIGETDNDGSWGDTELAINNQAQLVIETARKFEAYTCGDLDAEEAALAAEELGVE